jgi:hypothetical protein
MWEKERERLNDSFPSSWECFQKCNR